MGIVTFAVTERSGGAATARAEEAARAAAAAAGGGAFFYADASYGNFLESRLARRDGLGAALPGASFVFLGFDGVVVRIMPLDSGGDEAARRALRAAKRRGGVTAKDLAAAAGAAAEAGGSAAFAVALSESAAEEAAEAEKDGTALPEKTTAAAAAKLAEAAKAASKAVGARSTYVEARVAPGAPSLAKAGAQAAAIAGAKPLAAQVAGLPDGAAETLETAAWVEAARTKSAPKDPRRFRILVATTEKEASEALRSAIGKEAAAKASRNASALAKTERPELDVIPEEDAAKIDELRAAVSAAAEKTTPETAKGAMAQLALVGAGDAAAYLAAAEAAKSWKAVGGTTWHPRRESLADDLSAALGVRPAAPRAAGAAWAAKEPEPGATVPAGSEAAFAAEFGEGVLVRATEAVRHDRRSAAKAAARVASMQDYGSPNEYGATASRMSKEAAEGKEPRAETEAEKKIAKIAAALVGKADRFEPGDVWTFAGRAASAVSEPTWLDEDGTRATDADARALRAAGAPTARIEGTEPAKAADAYFRAARAKGAKTTDGSWTAGGKTAATPATLAKAGPWDALAGTKGLTGEEAAAMAAKTGGIGTALAAALVAEAQAAARAKRENPAEYAAAVMSVAEGTPLAPTAAAEAAELGVEILRPDVNASKASAVVENGAVRLGFSSAKGVDGEAAEAARGDAPYESLADFLERSGIGAHELKSLARAGAFDAFGVSRRGLLAVADKLAKRAERARRTAAALEEARLALAAAETEADRTKAFVAAKRREEELESARAALAAMAVPSRGAENAGTALEDEAKALGFNIGGGPLDGYESDARGATQVAALENGETTTIFAVATRLEIRETKNGREYATFRAADRTGEIRCVCWPKTWAEAKKVVAEGAAARLFGETTAERGSQEFRVLKARPPGRSDEAFLSFVGTDAEADAAAEGRSARPRRGPARLLVYSKESGTIAKTDLYVDPEDAAKVLGGRRTRRRVPFA